MLSFEIFSQINYNTGACGSSVDININFYPAISFPVDMVETSSNGALWLSIHKCWSANGLQAFPFERKYFKYNYIQQLTFYIQFCYKTKIVTFY